MAKNKKNKTSVPVSGTSSVLVHKPQSAKELGQLYEDLKSRGFVPMGMPLQGDIPMEASASSQKVGGLPGMGGDMLSRAFSFDNAEARAIPVASCGTPGLGYVPWGANNDLPLMIPGMAGSLPYTASPIKYLADLSVGLGPKLVYRYSYVRGGKVESCHIPFEDAEALLWEDKKYEERAALLRCKDEVLKFSEENDLTLHHLGCMQDDIHMEIYFPMVGFSRGRTGGWNPKIVSIDQLAASCTRLEQMDVRRRINYVYYSERWRTSGGVATGMANEIVAYPAVMPQHRLRDLRRLIDQHQHDRIKDRPTWVCLPTFYPSGNRPYYPQPAWWSIFPSDAYSYISTIFSDKNAARKNKTMFGKILYINMNYLNTLFAQSGAKTQEEQMAIRSQIYESVSNFLRRRENHGKLMVMDSWIEADKLWKSVELVDVTESTNDAVTASEKELEGAANVIFLALGVDPRLVGVALSGSTNGGTFQRELSLLKQQQLASKQHLYLNFLNTIPRFNGWDPHLEYIIEQQVLTTLDRSKTGLETTESSN